MKYILSCLVSFGFILSGERVFASFIPQQEILMESLTSDSNKSSNISEEEFHQILQQLEETYAPLAKKHRGKLKMSGNWKSNTLNAGARQQFGSWQVKITGAIARRPELTADGFTLILCHELGHHFGGFPTAPADMPLQGQWGATEGQADYFSTQVCARKIWSQDFEKNAKARESVTPFAQAACDGAWAKTTEQELCYRTQVAIESMIRTMAVLKKDPMPRPDTPEQKIVLETVAGHPSVQCRMDTAFQAALCTQSFDENIIPGKKTPGGPSGIEAEREAAMNSCTQLTEHRVGLRPSCWYKAKL